MVLGILYPHLGSFVSLIGIYGMILAAFGRLTWARYGRVNRISFQMVLIGSLLNILTHVLFAFKKYDVMDFEKSNALIVALYCIGQGMITYGIIEGNKKGKKKRD